MPAKQLTRNAARCHRCGTTIESKWGHHFVTCQCGDVSVDGGLNYERRVFKPDAKWDELCEYIEEDVAASQISPNPPGVALRDFTPEESAALDRRDRLVGLLAQLRHAYHQGVTGRIGDQKAFAEGLLAPAIRTLEAYIDEEVRE